MVSKAGVGRLAIVLSGTVLFAALGVGLFVVYPETVAELLGVVLTLGVLLVGVKIAGSVAGSLFPGYDVAEVAVEGRLRVTVGWSASLEPTSDAGGRHRRTDRSGERRRQRTGSAGEAEHAWWGGRPERRHQARGRAFRGPTIAYATDVCASGATGSQAAVTNSGPAKGRSSARSASSARG